MGDMLAAIVVAVQTATGGWEKPDRRSEQVRLAQDTEAFLRYTVR